GASVVDVDGSGTTYSVTVDTGGGDGTIRLDVIDDDTIRDSSDNPLASTGSPDGSYFSGPSYTIDRTPPAVISVVPADPNPTGNLSVRYTVTFSEAVTGVGLDDFALITEGVPGAMITQVTGSGSVYTVRASTGDGDGTIRLRVVDDDSIRDAVDQPLGGEGAGNGSHLLGTPYTVFKHNEIRGTIWDDADRDGLRDPAEPGVAGALLFLDTDGDRVWDVGEPTTMTADDDPGTPDVDETGRYAFGNLASTTYTVVAVPLDGWEQTSPATRSGGTGRLTYVETVWDNQNGVDGLDEAAGVAVSPDGNHIYVAAYTDDALTVFRRDAATGRATFVQTAKNNVDGVEGLNGAQSVALSPDGRHVYVASTFDDSVVAFARNAATGEVTFVERYRDGFDGVDGLNMAISVAVSNDGAHVYAAGGEDDAIAVFSRDAGTGRLTFLQVIRNGDPGITNMDGPYSVAISPDDAHVYVTGQVSDSLVVFARDPATGMLSFVEAEKDGVGGVNGLNSASGLTVSPDGKHVYVASRLDDGIAVFSRNPVDGRVTFVQFFTVTSTALDFVVAVAVSQDGNQIYSAAEFYNKAGVFNRNVSTGRLTFLEEFQDGVGGVDGLWQAWWATVSPDDEHVYIVGASDDALVVFDRDAGVRTPVSPSRTLTFGEVVENVDFGNFNLLPAVDSVVRAGS
ncbi:MAG: beta-propeller fold lactonase family protein, partial [Planctomycetes bacterium]|nr:beta-propeller fold lactonase family protein [Planctomycetota bacterium]